MTKKLKTYTQTRYTAYYEECKVKARSPQEATDKIEALDEKDGPEGDHWEPTDYFVSDWEELTEEERK
jgi:hypothetical protein